MIRVMVVEDHDLIREVISEVLSAEEDIDVVGSCPDGQVAIQRLAEARPDVVITDLSMPRLGGVEVTAHVRNHYPDATVLVLTSAPDGERAAAARAAGAHAVLAKSGDPSALVTAVRETRSSTRS